ncbi:hypothetical protein H5V45_10125 [Nocardioides sp. KIGAM211]|uniref:Uncharacterized protein n=1 Tax=Nocardioides luti TaxID=2761101 RepID=A0A7X0RG44_9ACTN|nr:hypothetical protein [Nocardioides luti]MBB6627676.1 hypothetical protein [Nocardioides luti]
MPPTVFTNISDMITGLLDAGETIIDQAVIDDVKEKLQKAQQQMDANRFSDVEVEPAAFGDTSAAASLGYHHTKAHQVISDTLQGVLVDLERFRNGIVKAETLLADADSTSEADLKKKQQATELLSYIPRHSQGDRANHQSRNEHLPTNGGADA